MPASLPPPPWMLRWGCRMPSPTTATETRAEAVALIAAIRAKLAALGDLDMNILEAMLRDDDYTTTVSAALCAAANMIGAAIDRAEDELPSATWAHYSDADMTQDDVDTYVALASTHAYIVTLATLAGVAK